MNEWTFLGASVNQIKKLKISNIILVSSGMEFLRVIFWEINSYLHDLEFIPLTLHKSRYDHFYIEEKHLFNCPH